MSNIKFLKSLVFLALAAVVILPVYTFFYVSPSFTNLITKNTENTAESIALHLADMFFIAPMNISAANLPADLPSQIAKASREFGLMKVKIFSALGETVYSTDPRDIGIINRHNYFHKIVAAGKKFAKIVRKDHQTLEAQIMPVDVVETYVPIMRNNKFIGAFEIYYDITAGKDKLDNLIFKFYATQFPIAFFLLLGILFTLHKTYGNIRDRSEVEKKIHANEKRFRSLFEHSNDAIIIHTQDGNILDVNERACEILGYNLQRFRQITIQKLLNGNINAESKRAMAKVIDGGHARFETKFRKHDGSMLDVAVSSRITNGDGKEIQSIIRSISRRKQSEAELKRSYQTQTVLNKLLHLSLENLTLTETLELFIYYITSFPWLELDPKGAIFLVGEKESTLELKAHRGLNNSLQKICAKVPFGQCLCGRCALSGEVIFANCLDKCHDNRYDGIEPHGHYCVPILSSRKEVMGVFTLYIKSDSRHDANMEEILKAAASVVASVIQRKQAEEALQKSRDGLEVRVQERTIELEDINEKLEQELQDRRLAEKALQQSKQETDTANDEKDVLILDLFEIMYEMLANRDFSTFEHALRVAEISRRIGLEIELSDEEMEIIKHGCLVHDIGKIAIPDDVLLKPGIFDRNDRNIMQIHTLVGASLFAKHHHDVRIRNIILHHHERLDGSGYPAGLSGDSIGKLERIVAVADVFEALVSRRPYKRPMSRKKAVDILRFEVKEGRLDGDIVKVLEQVTKYWSPLEINSDYRADYTEDLEIFRQMAYFKEPLSDFYNYRYLLYLADAKLLKKNENPYHLIVTNFIDHREFTQKNGFIKADQILDELGQQLFLTTESFRSGCSKEESAVMLFRKGTDFLIYSECEEKVLLELLDEIKDHLEGSYQDWGLKSRYIHLRFDNDYPAEKALNEVLSAA